MSLLLRQIKIVDSQSSLHNKVVDIFIEDGIISKIGTEIKVEAKAIFEKKNHCIARGFTDVFADYREPGFENKETLESGMKCATAGGFTNVFLTPNTNPPTTSKSNVQSLLQRVASNLVTLHPIGGISKNLEGKSLAEMLDMQRHGAIAFSEGWNALQSAGLMMKALEYVKAFDGILIQIPLDETLAEGGLMHESERSVRMGMPGIPTLAEITMLHRDLELLKYTQSRLHITGISTAGGVDLMRKAKKEKLRVSCSVTPYHLALTDDALRDYESVFKVSPALRSEGDRIALIEGLKDGTIDCIASHHRPQDWDSKTQEFEYAGYGMNIQEIAFPIVWNSVQDEVPLERVVDAFSFAPRTLFGLPALNWEEGAAADFTIFSPDDETVLKDENVCSLSRNNPFLNKKLKGKIAGIIHNFQHQLTH